MEKGYRNHPYTIIINTINDMKIVIPFILLIIFKFQFKQLIIGILLIFLCFKNFFKWKNTKFNIEGGILKYKSGIIYKKKLEIAINRISTIDLGQDIVQGILNVYRVKIDSGSVGLGKEGSEIDIILKEDLALNIRDFIRKSINPISNNNKNYYNVSLNKEICINENTKDKFTISNKELFISAITKNNIGVGVGLLIAFHKILEKIDDIFNINILNKVSKYIDMKTAYAKSTVYFIYFLIILFIILLFISIILSIIGSIIKFHGFTVYKKYNYIIIEYGLISKKSYSLPIKSINAIKLKQNFIRQKFNLYRIEVSTVGYGDESGEEAIIYPIANKKLTKKIISTILPEFNYNVEINNPPKEALIKFMFIPILITFITCSIISYIKVRFSIIFLILPIVIMSRYLKYKNTGVGFNDSIFICTCNGFNKETILVKLNSIQSISVTSNYFQRKKNLCSYKINFYSNKITDLIKIKHLKDEYFRKLENKIEF
ncbi:PH domain-containing protein [Clostridium botulinum C]|uniref:YdbS-like PH domain-containing protein n=3 Tax=Clostridium TaxID=1485 RepID=A0A9Q4TJW3_CLOBO|nr:PH domain-containing protein [Clostridium botulinum]MCD3194653.1 PH domain-containing protein [Clostridium botulinum C]MCD3200046.1 PH domain-containing protein [Clostridium botulinum C]MCD3205521.1 PH domain-containing protein [Clostridium botulinum C]MCD3208528.1 PH domain-containing protein [Clostridium botulinum C]MCD3224420.1 PH domain-containing protein [Clostridium botulinum C]